MLQNFLIILVFAFIAFEIIEHVLIPIVWLFLKRKRNSEYGIEGMKGKTVEIKSWDDKSGIVLFHAERWKAVADKPMQPGEKAIIREVTGLTLRISELQELDPKCPESFQKYTRVRRPS